MPLFGSSSPFDTEVEKVTNEKNTTEDWGMIMHICDRVISSKDGAKDCLRSVIKRLNHQDPHVVMQAIVVLDACVNNCGKPFRLGVASRDFEHDYKKLLARSHPKVQDKLKAMLKKWAESEFKGDPQFSLIPSLYHTLKREGVDFSGGSDQPKKAAVPKDPNVVSSQQEEEDIAKAIQASLQEAGGPSARGHGGVKQKAQQQSQPGSLYPSMDLGSGGGAGGAAAGSGTAVGTVVEPKKARALYDFEAAEDNELTFKTGEVVIVTDDSDVNWWKGSNHRGEGLFPANFVTTDLKGETEEPQRRRSVQFSEQVEVKTLKDEEAEIAAAAGALGPVEISEEKIDRVLNLLNDSDPTTDVNDDPALTVLEDHVNKMGPLIDNELEGVDRRLAQLTRLSTELVDSLNLYHQLMRDMPAQAYQMPAAAAPYGMGLPGMQPPPPLQQQQQAAYMQPPSYNTATGQPMYAPQPQALPPVSTAGYQMPPAAPPVSADTTTAPSTGAPMQHQQIPPHPTLNGQQPNPHVDPQQQQHQQQYAWHPSQMPPPPQLGTYGGPTQPVMSPPQNGYPAVMPTQQHGPAIDAPLNA